MNKSSDEKSTSAAMYQKIREKLEWNFRPVHLDLVNESHMHSVPPNSETHFKLVMVSDEFTGKKPLQRHQAVYKLLAEELAGGVHALALHLYTREEWAAQGTAPESPQCLGGGKH